MHRTPSLVLLLATLLVACFASRQSAVATPAPPSLAGTWSFLDGLNPNQFEGRQPPVYGTVLEVSETSEAIVFTWSENNAEVVHHFQRDGSEEEVTAGRSTSRHSATWKGDQFVIQSAVEVAGPGGLKTKNVSTRTVNIEGDNLVIDVNVTKPFPTTFTSVYRRESASTPKESPSKPTDKPKEKPSKKPTKPAKPEEPTEPATPASTSASIDSLAWLGGAWKGTMGNGTIEESWMVPDGGSMLGVSRTISNRKMTQFEFLRIVERDGTLIYVAQPEGGVATEFPLAKAEEHLLVFENPVHDFPQRITYRLTGEKSLTAEVSDLIGARVMKFSFRRVEGK
ncbi:MAG: hypothetical protein JNL80_13870 [Phycisphaerae bacterium]|nr:hypothetical protein [Phycisphaerae bacterium]